MKHNGQNHVAFMQHLVVFEVVHERLRHRIGIGHRKHRRAMGAMQAVS